MPGKRQCMKLAMNQVIYLLYMSANILSLSHSLLFTHGPIGRFTPLTVLHQLSLVMPQMLLFTYHSYLSTTAEFSNVVSQEVRVSFTVYTLTALPDIAYVM